MAFIPSHSINTTSEIHYPGSHTLSSPAPQLNASIDDQIIWKLSAPDPPYGPEHPCYQYYEQQKEESKKKIGVLPINRYHDHSLDLLVGTDHLAEWNKCHLLSLPKELRLEIWEYVLTDPSIPEVLVDISRQHASPYLRHARPLAPKFSITPRRHAPINVNLLQVNRVIYEEALPILYKSAKFAPRDLEGLLPQFLDRLSPFAQSLIRRIKLHLPAQVTSPVLRLDPSRPFFHWAITCAQVAKINASLQEVEIQGEWAIFANEANRRAVLSPLCKIKATKKFTPLSSSSAAPEHYDEQFQILLEEVAEHLKAVAEVRSERTKADIIRVAQQAELWRQIREAERIAAEVAAETNATGPRDEMGFHHDMDEDLSAVAGIEQFEQELKEHILPDYKPLDEISKVDESQMAEDWDLVSLKSGASTPRVRPASVISKISDGTWTDTASTVVGGDEIVKENDSDAESETWEEL